MRTTVNKSEAGLQRKHFNDISDVYITSRSGKNHLAYKGVIWQFVLKMLSENLPSDSEIKGLEAMCGIAEASRWIVNYFPNISMDAFDFSDSMVDAAIKKVTDNRIRIFHGNILEFDQKEKYDLIVVIGGLHHIFHSVQDGLININNALKKGGIFLNLEPTHNNILWRVAREKIYKTNPIFEEENERAFTLDEYNGLLIKNNFKISYQFYPGLLGYILYYNPDAFPALNLGTPKIAELTAKVDILLGRTFIGKVFSFVTWVIAKKEI